MKLKSVSYRPVFSIELSGHDLYVLTKCARAHYDGSTQGLPERGDFLYGMLSQAIFAHGHLDDVPVGESEHRYWAKMALYLKGRTDEMTEHVLTWRQVDRLNKALEGPPSAFAADADKLSELFGECFRQPGVPDRVLVEGPSYGRRLAALLDSGNYVDEDCLSETVLDLMSKTACDINNRGFGAQLDFIVEDAGFDFARQVVAEVLNVAPSELPSPEDT